MGRSNQLLLYYQYNYIYIKDFLSPLLSLYYTNSRYYYPTFFEVFPLPGGYVTSTPLVPEQACPPAALRGWPSASLRSLHAAIREMADPLRIVSCIAVTLSWLVAPGVEASGPRHRWPRSAEPQLPQQLYRAAQYVHPRVPAQQPVQQAAPSMHQLAGQQHHLRQEPLELHRQQTLPVR